MVTIQQYNEAKKIIAEFEMQAVKEFESKEFTIDMFYMPLRELRKVNKFDTRILNTLIACRFKTLAEGVKYDGDITKFRNWGEKTQLKFNIIKEKYNQLYS